MPKILQLDRHVANLIAAGEVVERPASAVKELVENAVDAGADQVTVEIQDGGMTYLRVTDNGCGIAPEDAETAFLRHATSKLRTKEDLTAIGTLGFRGEALAAIASVSKIDLLTKTAQDEGIALHLEAGKVTERSPAGCPEGTTIVVRELFYNTPARMKFMKRDSVEASQVAGTVQRQALAHPNVAFRLIKDGETVLQTAGNGDLYGTVYQVFGRQLAADMLPVKSQWESYSLGGYVTRPTATRGNRNCQQFFVNGRPVKSKLLSSALEQAYENQMMAGRFPSCVLALELPRNLVDVNVHPAKTEVKFANERAVFDCVRFAVLSTLNRNPGRPEMQLEKKREEPKNSACAVPAASGSEKFQSMTAEQFRTYAAAVSNQQRKPAPDVIRAIQRPAAQQGFLSAVAPAKEPPAQTVPVHQDIQVPVSRKPSEPMMPEKQTEPAPRVNTEKQPEPVQTELPMPEPVPYRVVGEVFNTYIIIEQADAVLFMDKHAAHERILFEELKSSRTPVMAQVLLEPMTAGLTREEAAAVLENQTLLRQYGYEVEDFGDGEILIRQIPAELDENQAENALEELAQILMEGQTRDPESIRDSLLHTIACKAAIKAGWHTDQREREELVRQVLTRDDIKYCPHGRPVITTLTKKQLEKQFKRT